MTVRIDALPPRLGWIVVGAGIALLVLRPFAVVEETDQRLTLLGAGYAATMLASIAVPVAPGRPRSAPLVALLLGVAGVAVVATAGAPAAPVAWGVAALPLSLLAAVAEEALFRRVAYARLERWGAVVAVLGSAVLFAIVHVPAYGVAALPVDVGAGVLFGWQRWASGTWTVPAATHAFANAMVVLG